MKLNTVLALIGTLIAVMTVFFPHLWLLAVAVILIGVAYLVFPN